MKKGFIVVAAAIGGLFKWLLGRGKREKAAAPDTPPDTDAPPGV